MKTSFEGMANIMHNENFVKSVIISVWLLGLFARAEAEMASGQGFPHEPTGPEWTLFFDETNNDKSGWGVCNPKLATVVDQPDEPISPPSALKWHFPKGSSQNSSGVAGRAVNPGATDIYAGFSFKLEGGYNMSVNGGAKWIFFNSEPGWQVRYMGHFAARPSSVDCTDPIGWDGAYQKVDSEGKRIHELWVHPNLGKPSMQLGRWYRVELFLTSSSKINVPDGQYHAFITDDQGVTTKITEYTNFATGGDLINQFAVTPMFGDPKPAFTRTLDHYFYLGHWRVKGGKTGAVTRSLSRLEEVKDPAPPVSDPVSDIKKP
jgi:hypothetical protein